MKLEFHNQISMLQVWKILRDKSINFVSSLFYMLLTRAFGSESLSIFRKRCHKKPLSFISGLAASASPSSLLVLTQNYQCRKRSHIQWSLRNSSGTQFRKHFTQEYWNFQHLTCPLSLPNGFFFWCFFFWHHARGSWVLNVFTYPTSKWRC